MTWPWRNDLRTGSGTDPSLNASLLSSPTNIDTLLIQADTLRDAARWPEAATAYQSVLLRAPQNAAIWVQLGHALKESHDLPASEAAYRTSLTLSPDTADTHLQLGHVLKLQGHRPAAIAAYAAALRADRSCTPALTELIAMGEAWGAEQAAGLGLPMLGALLETAAQLRTALTRLELALPDAASLASIPPALFHTRYRLPPPPAPLGKPGDWAVLALDHGQPGAVVALLRSLAAQCAPPVSVTIASTEPATQIVTRQFDNAALLCPIDIVPAGSLIAPPNYDWLLVCASGSILVPHAKAWLDWAASQTDAAGFYVDEAGPNPVLKAAHDPEADAPPYRHTVLALRGPVEAAVLAKALPTADPLQAIADHVAANGGIGHLARILAHRLREPLPPPRRQLPNAQQPQGIGTQGQRVGVIIPTRNGATMLRDCVDALRETAAEPARLDIVILDNGSDDPDTLALLARLEARGVARVLRDPAPFNWSRLSNAGVAACKSELLLFLNDDVTLGSAGWDQTLRRQLARPNVGAVGARLDYPDGGLQHAGIVFGPGGRMEHEGVAAIGVLPDIAARWVARRRVGAVTGAFLGCRRSDFQAVGGFDAAHLPIWFNDIDFCLKLRRAERIILFEPTILATHHESRTLSAQPHDAARQEIWDDSLRTMQQRWGQALVTDPGFNPHFSRHGRPFELMMEPSTHAIREHLVRSSGPDPWRPASP